MKNPQFIYLDLTTIKKVSHVNESLLYAACIRSPLIFKQKYRPAHY